MGSRGIELQCLFDLRDSAVFHLLANQNFAEHEVGHGAIGWNRKHLGEGLARVVRALSHDVADTEQIGTVGVV